MRSEIAKSHLLVFLATVLVAGSFIASEKLAPVINPISLTLLRFLSASLILAPIIFFREACWQRLLSVMPRAMLISLFYSSFFIGLFEALKTTSSLNTSTLFTLVPLITAIMSVIMLRDKLNNRQFRIYLLGAVGTLWVIFQGDVDLLLTFSLNQGDLLFLFAMLAMCCYSISMKLLYRNDDMFVLVFCTLLGGSFWMLLALILFDQPLEWNKIVGYSVLHMIYLVVGATLVTVYLYQRTTIVLGPGRVNAYIYLNPALVALLLFFIDGVSIPLAILPGVFLSTVATIILQRKSRTD